MVRVMTDLTSRKDAIKILQDWGNPNTPFMDREQAMKMAIDALKAEPQWIPCGVRLPEEFGEYLVTKKAIGWNCEEYTSNDIAYFDNEGFHKADKVLAWMPLPEPYGGESDG